MKPQDIEKKSFEIIDHEAGPHEFEDDKWQIVRRMIHTSADFEYIKSVRFHPQAVSKGIQAILNGKMIITDTLMALSGIRKKALEKFGCRSLCLIADPEVSQMASQNGITRAKAAVQKAASIMEDGIYVVGNAPTALLHLLELVEKGTAKPALVIGLPVGFVNAAESKELLIRTDIPYISNMGRKGGSNIAASVVNALLILAENDKAS